MRYLLLIGILFIENSLSMPAYFKPSPCGDINTYAEVKLLQKEFNKMVDYGTECFKNGIVGEHFEQAMKEYHIERARKLEDSDSKTFHGRDNFVAGALYEYYKDIVKFKNKSVDDWKLEMELNEIQKQTYDNSIEQILVKARKNIKIKNNCCNLESALLEITKQYIVFSQNPIVKNCMFGVNKNYRLYKQGFIQRELLGSLTTSYNLSKNETKRLGYGLREPEYYLRKMYKMLYPGQEIPENLYAAPPKKGCVIM